MAKEARFAKHDIGRLNAWLMDTVESYFSHYGLRPLQQYQEDKLRDALKATLEESCEVSDA